MPIKIVTKDFVMRNYLVLILVLLFLLQSGCSVPSGVDKTATENVRVNSSQMTWDFGQIRSGEKVKHEFILKNDTDKLINVKDVTTSCGCTVSSIKKKILKPQETVALDVQFDSAGYAGDVEQHVYVSTDSLKDPVLRFIIKANVVK